MIDWMRSEKMSCHMRKKVRRPSQYESNRGYCRTGVCAWGNKDLEFGEEEIPAGWCSGKGRPPFAVLALIVTLCQCSKSNMWALEGPYTRELCEWRIKARLELWSYRAWCLDSHKENVLFEIRDLLRKQKKSAMLICITNTQPGRWTTF